MRAWEAIGLSIVGCVRPRGVAVVRVLSPLVPAFLMIWAGGAGLLEGVEPTATAAPWRIERTDLDQKLAASASVSVENLYGDLRVRTGGRGELSVHAVLQRAEADDALRIELVAEAKGWRVRVVEPGPSKSPEGPSRRADLAILVPADTPLSLRTGSGLVEARGFAAALAAETSTGEIRLRGSGAVAVRSDRGAVRLAFHPVAPDGPSRLETSTGDIEVELPPRASAEARMETQGSLTTDFTLVVERVGPLTKRAHARLGNGGPEIKLLSRTGDLRLLERLAVAPSAAP